MVVKEGSLEAPQRHAIDWQNPDFYDESALNQELHRVYDVCHGCRRCFNLCHAFPTLFDLIDESKTGELDSVDVAQYGQVVDQCYLCDMCFLTKCPYVPPHPLNIDFPHLMLRAKAVKHKKHGARFRDRLLSNTDLVGKLASIPVVVKMVNGTLHSTTARKMLDSTLGIHKDRRLPHYHSSTFKKTARTNERFPVLGSLAPGKVAIYATCYINYNEPSIGLDLLKVLEHNQVPVRMVEKEACCGMPKLELGDLNAVERLKEINIPPLAKLAREGYAILAAVPSCVLMYKQELPLLFPDDEDVRAVAQAFYDPFDYLLLRHKEGLLKTDFKQGLGKISYHVPCHQRVQNIGLKTRDLLQMVPDTSVSTVERCSGHDGTWGVKSEFFEKSMQIGKPVFKLMSESHPDFISSDCAIAARQIHQGMGSAAPPKHHPITLIKMAYGL
mgnify:CR=1 FL=1